MSEQGHGEILEFTCRERMSVFYKTTFFDFGEKNVEENELDVVKEKR
jgi:hypothetical protein